MRLGKLEKIPLRHGWSHEALNFTNWLAKPENLELLSNEIGIDIVLTQTEASVGKFNVDILAEEENRERKIIIENQLEATDHDHLGKIVTYAAGHDAEIVIWIVKEVRDEHKKAIDWLNDITNESINFFAIKIELWKIGNSDPAPKFNIISKPNNWAKALKKSNASSQKASELNMLQLEFWSSMNDYFETNPISVNMKSPRAQSYYNLALGFGNKVHLALNVHSVENYCSVKVYIPNSKELFFGLLENKEQIEMKTGLDFEWMELPERQASQIRIKKEGFDLNNTEEWEEAYKWFAEIIEKIKPVFVGYVENSDY